MRRKVAGIVLTVPLLFAAACSSASSSGSSNSDPVTAPATSTTEAATHANLEVEFVRALTSHTAEGVEAAARSTVPGSSAAQYVDFERLRDEVRREAGEAPGPENVQGQDDRVVMSYPMVGMYRAFTDFVFDGDLISSFSVASVPIERRVVGPGEAVTVGGDTYQIAGARIDSLGQLSVVVQVTGGSPGTVLPQDATLNTTAGAVPSDFSGSVPLSETAPGASILAYYEFLNPANITSISLHVCTQGTNVCEDITLPFLSTQTA
jgi:hypothetical protein